MILRLDGKETIYKYLKCTRYEMTRLLIAQTQRNKKFDSQVQREDVYRITKICHSEKLIKTNEPVFV